MSTQAAANVAFTAREAAKLFGVSPSTIRNWAEDHLITCVGTKGNAKLYPYGELAEADHRMRHDPHLRSGRAGDTLPG